MDENFSRVGFLYGMAFVLAVAKACTLWIWRTLPKPRPPMRQEIAQAWRDRAERRRMKSRPASPPPPVARRDESASSGTPPTSAQDEPVVRESKG